MEQKYYTNEKSQQIIIALLKAHGINKVVASPGTTNMTLVASMQQDSFFEMYSSVDERSAAYIACGLSAESGEPVVITCTEATASRNYMSGLTEAFYRKLPIIAITATHGINQIGHLHAQVIDRQQQPNDIVKKSICITSSTTPEEEKINKIKINTAILELKRHGGGPIHINLESKANKNFSIKELPPVHIIKRIMPYDTFPEIPNGKIAIFIGAHKKWTKEEELYLDQFCASHNAVAFCDHTSGYKGKYRVLYSLVACQRQYHSETLKIDLLIHIGEISGDYYTQNIQPKECWRVNEDGEVRNRFNTLTHVFEMPESYFFKHYIQTTKQYDSYLKECIHEYDKIYTRIPEIPFSNIWIASQLASQLPQNSTLHLGILNSLRSWNFFEIDKTISSNCNVGGFGIDGILSSLIGASLSNPNKLYFGILGDLAFFYDLNSLGNHHIGKNLRILLINNGRGTEFRNYGHPGYIFGDDADKYIAAAGHFGNKSPELIKHYANDLNFEYLCASNKNEFNSQINKFITPQENKSIIFEVYTDSNDESKALEIMQNIIETKLTTFKKNIKNIIGDKGVNIIKSVVK